MQFARECRQAYTRRLLGLSTLTRDEMRFAGYSDDMPQIDVCAGKQTNFFVNPYRKCPNGR